MSSPSSASTASPLSRSNTRSVRRHRTTMRAVSMLLVASSVDAFTRHHAFLTPPRQYTSSSSSVSMFAPPGSGYARPEDEKSALPDTYEPMMEYPGTMRPGRTPENMPFQDLPIGDDDPDPVPWPHFQQIEWHHQWEPPHPHPIPMEEFIEMNGRWATAEMEAAMRAGFRRDVRDRREQAEAEKRDVIITDDDDDEEGEEPVALGDGIFGKLGSDADRALTAKATAPPKEGTVVEEEIDESLDDAGLDDFLLDLGLDVELEDDIEEPAAKGDDDDEPPVSSKKAKASFLDDEDEDVDDDLDLAFNVDDDDDDDGEESISMKSSTAITVDEDSDLDLGLDDDDDLSDDGDGNVPLDDFNDNETLETLDTEDIFDEGGFDFDDGDFDGGDDW